MKIQRILCLFALSIIAQTHVALADCHASVSRKWNISSKTRLTIDAAALGSDCKRTVVVIVVRDSKDQVKYTLSMAAEDNAIFSSLVDAPVTNTMNMRAALGEWIDAGLSSKKNRLSQYLEWKAGAEGPAENPPAEFPFTVNSDVSRETYEKWRKQNLPVFCFVQGMESIRCLVLTTEGTISEVGIQSFPG
jgi:hypothetical protein